MLRKALFIALILIFASCAEREKVGNEARDVTVPTEPKFEKRSDEYSSVVEKMPEIIGGLKSISSKIKYPEEAKKAGVEGTVYVMAYINEAGIVDKVEVLKGIGYGCDEVAAEAVKNTRFKPGYNNGKPVKVKVVVPIKFKLSKEK